MSKFEKLTIKLTEKNERILREMYQFSHRTDISFETFVNHRISDMLFNEGFE